MPLIDIAALLRPVTEAEPCGPDLVRDPAFLALAQAAAGKPEREMGKVVVPATEPNWPEVQRLAVDLLGRSKDLRVAMHLLRAWTRSQGLAGFARGLQLIHALLERYWDGVHPLLDAEENGDPTRRMNALAALADPTAVPLDLRAATLDGSKLSVTGRQLELAAGRQQPRQGEGKPTPEGVRQALRDAEARESGLLLRLHEAHATLLRLETLLAQRVPGAMPDLQPLRSFTQLLTDTIAPLLDPAATPVATPAVPAPALAAPPPVPAPDAGDGAIRTREDAMRQLQAVSDWMQQNEPGHPAPLLILRARRLMAKSFIEIVEDLLPDGVEQVHKLAGAAGK